MVEWCLAPTWSYVLYKTGLVSYIRLAFTLSSMCVSAYFARCVWIDRGEGWWCVCNIVGASSIFKKVERGFNTNKAR